MAVLEGAVYGLVEVTIVDFVEDQAGRSLRHLVKLAPEILALLVGALRGRRQRGQFVVDLHQQLSKLPKVQRAALVSVVLLKQAIETAQMRAGLREALLDLLRNNAPFGKRDVHFLGVLATFIGEIAQEVDKVVGDVVLDGGAVANGVDGAERGAVEAQVGVCLEGVFVGLDG